MVCGSCVLSFQVTTQHHEQFWQVTTRKLCVCQYAQSWDWSSAEPKVSVSVLRWNIGRHVVLGLCLVFSINNKRVWSKSTLHVDLALHTSLHYTIKICFDIDRSKPGHVHSKQHASLKRWTSSPSLSMLNHRLFDVIKTLQFAILSFVLSVYVWVWQRVHVWSTPSLGTCCELWRARTTISAHGSSQCLARATASSTTSEAASATSASMENFWHRWQSMIPPG